VESEGYTTISESFFLEQDTTVNVQLQIVSIGGDETEGSIRFFPNPVRDKLFITNVHGKAEIKLIGLDGRIWWHKKLHTESVNYDVSDLPAGIYTLKMSSAGANHSSRLIKL